MMTHKHHIDLSYREFHFAPDEYQQYDVTSDKCATTSNDY